MTNIYRSERGARLVQERYWEFLNRWPVPSWQLRVPTRQGETFIVACGDENAPPLLLFHGAGTNSAMWMDDVAAWADHFRVYAVDMIGEPGLSAPSRPSLASDAYALWLDDVMEALSLARASIIGVSLGGWLALDYATRRPDRVDRLVLVGPGGVGRQRIRFLLKVAPLMMLGRRGRNRAMEIAFGIEAMHLTPNFRRFMEFLVLLLEHYRPRMGWLPIFSDSALKRLTMPVMVIVGGRDAILDSAQTRRRMEFNVAHSEVCYLPKAGHVIVDQSASILEFCVGGWQRETETCRPILLHYLRPPSQSSLAAGRDQQQRSIRQVSGTYGS